MSFDWRSISFPLQYKHRRFHSFWLVLRAPWDPRCTGAWPTIVHCAPPHWYVDHVVEACRGDRPPNNATEDSPKKCNCKSVQWQNGQVSCKSLETCNHYLQMETTQWETLRHSSHPKMAKFPTTLWWLKAIWQSSKKKMIGIQQFRAPNNCGPNRNSPKRSQQINKKHRAVST